MRIFVMVNYIIILSRHSNGSNEQDEGDEHPDDGGSLSRSASETSLTQAQNGHVMNNGYRNITFITYATLCSGGSGLL